MFRVWTTQTCWVNPLLQNSLFVTQHALTHPDWYNIYIKGLSNTHENTQMLKKNVAHVLFKIIWYTNSSTQTILWEILIWRDLTLNVWKVRSFTPLLNFPQGKWSWLGRDYCWEEWGQISSPAASPRTMSQDYKRIFPRTLNLWLSPIPDLWIF